MALRLLARDTVTGREKLTTINPATVASLVVDSFIVGSGGQTDFTLVNGTVGASNLIEVLWNGVENREGSGRWTRDTGTNKIVFASLIPEGAWIKIRTYNA